MMRFEQLSVPAKSFLVALFACCILPYWSRFPVQLWKYPAIISLIGFGLLRLYGATKKKIFRSLYFPWMIFASTFILRNHGRMYALQQKWIVGAHFIALLICSASFLALISYRNPYAGD